nr:hypothetical protein [Tanacetum cinerariifolium]
MVSLSDAFRREDDKLVPLLELVDQLEEGIHEKEGHVDMMDMCVRNMFKHLLPVVCSDGVVTSGLTVEGGDSKGTSWVGTFATGVPVNCAAVRR